MGGGGGGKAYFMSWSELIDFRFFLMPMSYLVGVVFFRAGFLNFSIIIIFKKILLIFFWGRAAVGYSYFQ